MNRETERRHWRAMKALWRLQLHALAYNLGNFLRTLATPEPIKGLVADELEGEADQDRREGWRTFAMTMGRLGIILAALAIGAVYSAHSQSPFPEAPSGFDDEGIEAGLAEQHKQDKATFDKVDEKTPDGLGPIYNAQSCRECHQNPVSGAGSQITELRVGHRGSKGEFVFPEVPIIGDTIK